MEPARMPQQIFTVVEGGSPGHMMRSARERLGLSIDDVCEHLKMMPTQIRSMESDSLDGLPPGGYARAFIKGYARFLGLDADQVVNSLVALNADRKDVAGLPAMKISPAVAAQRQADAEEEEGAERSRREAVSVSHNFGALTTEPASDSRLVKYSLAALVIGLLIYLFVPGITAPPKSGAVTAVAPVEQITSPPPVMAERIPAGEPGAAPASGSEPAFPPGTVMVPAQPTEPPAGSVQVVPPPAAAPAYQAPQAYQQPPVQAVKPSPVPVAAAPVASAPAAPAAPTPAPAATAPVAKAPTPAAVPAAPVRQSAAPAPVAAAPASTQTAAVPTAPSAAASSPQRIRMVFSDRAYITIRDRDGHVLMAQLNPGNTEKVVEGNPPFKVIIGNAQAVRMEYRGRPYDLSAHTKDDVARFVME